MRHLSGTPHVAGTEYAPVNRNGWLGFFYVGVVGIGTRQVTGLFKNMKIYTAMAAAVVLLVAAALWAADSKPSSLTVEGFVLDSACAFTKNLKKPISADCATACAKAGSPLVILTDDGTIYWPIAKATPFSGQNARLLPFAGQRVVAKGEVFERGGSRALAIETIEASTKNSAVPK